MSLNPQFWWFVARAAGIVSWFMLTAAMVWGIVLATDMFPKHRRPAWLLDAHRWLSALALAFLGLHLGALVADSYVAFSLADLAIPLAGDWKPLPVAAGVIAMWTLAAVQVTSLARRRLPKPVWKIVHLSSYAAFWLASIHGTFSGTDATNWLYLSGTTAAVLAVVFGAVYRIIAPARGTARILTPKLGDPASDPPGDAAWRQGMTDRSRSFIPIDVWSPQMPRRGDPPGGESCD